MLLLTRRVGERIEIGEDTIVRVQAINGNRVVIGVSAPRTTKVLRGELKNYSRLAPAVTDVAPRPVALAR